MSNYEVIDEKQTTAGNVFQKVKYHGIDEIGIRKNGETYETDNPGKVMGGVTANKTDWNRSNATSDDYHGEMVTSAGRNSRPEYGKHIAGYDIDERSHQVQEQMERMDNFRKVYFQLKYRILYKDGKEDVGFIRSKTLNPTATEQMDLEIRDKIESLWNSMDDSPIEAIYIDRTDITGLNYK